jgi:NDP-sugar pyrophosphorylase family protein
MQAVIMAGGFGTRLRPLTANIPKPMTPLLNKPIIEHNVELLKKHKITDLVLILYHQAEIIKDYFKDGKKFGVKITYVKPDADYGTAGAVYCGNEFIRGRFIILSGDVVTDFDLTHAIAVHEKKKAAATLVLTRAKKSFSKNPHGARSSAILSIPVYTFSKKKLSGLYQKRAAIKRIVISPRTSSPICSKTGYRFSVQPKAATGKMSAALKITSQPTWMR